MSQSRSGVAPVKSPCIGVCALNKNDICEGCFRSAREITVWSQLNSEQKIEVVRLSWQRAKAAGKLL